MISTFRPESLLNIPAQKRHYQSPLDIREFPDLTINQIRNEIDLIDIQPPAMSIDRPDRPKIPVASHCAALHSHYV